MGDSTRNFILWVVILGFILFNVGRLNTLDARLEAVEDSMTPSITAPPFDQPVAPLDFKDPPRPFLAIALS